MTTTDEKLLEARTLLQAERYDDARKLLKKVNHPVAAEWLAKLDEMAPERKRTHFPVFLPVIVLVIALVGTALLVLPRVLPATASQVAADQSKFPLARYFTADTTMYMNLRTDDAHIQAIDALLARLMTTASSMAFNGPTPNETMTLSSLLDMSLQPTYGGDFQTVVRPWLGEQAALGLINFGPNMQGLLVVQITNREKATEFIEKSLSQNPNTTFTRSDEGGYTLFLPDDPAVNQVLAVGDSVLLFTSSKTLLPTTEPNPSLATDTRFQDTLELLPAESYTAVVYTNNSGLLNSMDQSLLNIPPNQPEAVTKALLSLDAQQAFGLTILDSRSLVLDTAYHITDMDSLTQLGYSLKGTGPVDPDFLAYVPADASFVVQGTDLKTAYELFTNVNQVNQRLLGTSEAAYNQQIAQIQQELKTLTGLDLQADILSWLTGEYAAFITYTPPPLGAPTIFTMSLYPEQAVDPGLEFGIVAEVTDSVKVQALVEKLAANVTQIGISKGWVVLREFIGGVNIMVVYIPVPGLVAPVEVIIGANEQVLVVGSRKAATNILTGSSGFNHSSAFTAAQTYLLHDATITSYMDANAILLLGDMLAASAPSMDVTVARLQAELNKQPYQPPDIEHQRTQVTQLRQRTQAIAALFSGVTFSMTGNAEGDSRFRYVLTFSE